MARIIFVMQPLTIDVRQTVEFFKDLLAIDNANILQIGCGDGRIAAGLMEAGYQVLGIDSDPSKIERAKSRGVRVEEREICDFETDEKFDVAFFSSSLHRVQSLDKAMDRVKALLGEKGRIVVEGFDAEAADEKTAEWYYELKDFALLLAGNEISKDGSSWERWGRESWKVGSAHSKSAMLRAVEGKFGNVYKGPLPYLYRLFVEDCEGSPEFAKALEHIYGLEQKAIKGSVLPPLGFRIVAKKYFSYLK